MASQVQVLATPVPAATQQIPVPVATGGGYGGTIALPVPSSLPANASIVSTTSNAALSSGGFTPPSLQSLLRQQAALRSPEVASAKTILFYLQLVTNATIPFPNAPAFAVTVPASAILPGASYYLAEYDPLRSSLGWQLGFEGPATIASTSLTFAAPTPAVPTTFSAYVPLFFAVYAVSVSVPSPTPAPSVTPAPTPTPIAGFTVAPSSVSLIGTGTTTTATITDPSGYAGSYTTTTSSASVATAVVTGTTVTITAVGSGQATLTVASADGRTANIAVTVTQTNVTVQGVRQ